MSRLRGFKLQYMGFCLAVFAFISTFFYIPAYADYIPTVSGTLFGSEQYIYSGYGGTIGIECITDTVDIYAASDLDPDTLYKFDYTLTFNFDADLLDYQPYNFRLVELWYGDLYLSAGWDVNNDNFEFASDTLTLSTKGSVIAYGRQLTGQAYKFHIVTASVLLDAPSFIFNYSIYINRSNKGLVALSGDQSDTYLQGFQNGYAAGESAGYAAGESAGYVAGESAGYDAGYAAGESDGYSEGYDQGYSSGVNSVNTQSYYDSGFSAGVESVDTDSFYNAGYAAGLESGYQDAYGQGYSEGVSFGYSEGYAAAKAENLEVLQSAGSSAGKLFTITQDLDVSKNALKLSDANTLLQSVYEYNHDEDVFYIDDDEYWLESGYADGIDFDGDGVIDWWDLEFARDSHYTDYDVTDSFKSYRGWSYYYTGAKKLFTADPSAYAYKIKVTPFDISAKYSNVNWARNTVGKWSDIMSGESEIGIGYIDGYSDVFTYFITTDNLPVDIYSAVLMYYYNEGTQDSNTYASYDISGGVYYEITPYSRNEYAAIMAGIDDLQSDINDRFGELSENLDQNFADLQESMSQEFDDLMNSYDTSAGDALNDDFSASLIAYQTSGDSLFNEAQSGLEGFTFVDFSSYPALVTAMSFTTSMMNAVFGAMGGETGPFGIVLSVLFSVMIVSMAIGLYRFYQNKKDGDG